MFVSSDKQGSAEFAPAGAQQQPTQQQGGGAAAAAPAAAAKQEVKEEIKEEIKEEPAGEGAAASEARQHQQQLPKDEPGLAQHDSKGAGVPEGLAVKQENGAPAAAAPPAVKREADVGAGGGDGSKEGSGGSDVAEAARWEAAARAAVRVYVR